MTDDLGQMTDAQLKPWPTYNRYLVSKSGRVYNTFRRHRSGRIFPLHAPEEMTRRLGTSGYWVVHLMQANGRQKTFFCHRMVLESWVGPCPVGMQCAHLDGTRTNCNLDNLLWVSPSENMFHQRKHGTALLGDRNHNAKLSDIQALAAIVMRKAGFGPKQIGELFGISRVAIQGIIRGDKYPHLQDESTVIALLRAKRAEKGAS